MKTTIVDQKQIHGEPSQKTNAKSVIDFRPFAPIRQHRSAVYWYKRMKHALQSGQDSVAWMETWDALKEALMENRQEYSKARSYGQLRNFAMTFSKLPESESGLVATMLYELSRFDENVDVMSLPSGQDFLDSFVNEKKK